MNISIKTFVFTGISVVVIAVSSYGFHLSLSMLEDNKISNHISTLEVDTPENNNFSINLEELNYNVLQSDAYLEFYNTQNILYQYPETELEIKNIWSFAQIEAVQKQLDATIDSRILVAILDTGIDSDHEDLNGKVIMEVNFTQSNTVNDIYGHGTHIAGIVSADGDNGKGITGLATQSRLLNVKVVNDDGSFNVTDLADGIIWAVDNGANVINISLASTESEPELKSAVDYAWEKGAIIVATAGNRGGKTPVYPAAYDNCIAVTAIKEDSSLVPLANYGNWVDIAAPGFNVYSTLPDNSYEYRHGTSFATAHISGLSALLFHLVTDTNNNGRLNDEVRLAIERGYINKPSVQFID